MPGMILTYYLQPCPKPFSVPSSLLPIFFAYFIAYQVCTVLGARNKKTGKAKYWAEKHVREKITSAKKQLAWNPLCTLYEH